MHHHTTHTNNGFGIGSNNFKPSSPTWQGLELHEIADTLLKKSRLAERTYLASLWLNPKNGHTAACNAGLKGAMFTTEPHSYLFWYVCTSFESGVRRSFQECVVLSESYPDSDWQLSELFCLTNETDTREGSEPLNAETVVDFYRKRISAQKHFRALAALEVGMDFVILVRPKVRRAALFPSNASGDSLFVPAGLRSALRRKSRAVTL